jgi:lysophospholipase L1-like esterase
MLPIKLLLLLSAAVVESLPVVCQQLPPYFILTGDSTVAVDGGWGDGFLAYLKNGASGINPAKSGATTVSFRDDGHWAAAINAMNQHKADYRPIVTIQFGHNDQKEASGISLAQYKQNLIDLAAEVKAAGGTPILVTSLTRRTFQGDKVIENLADQRRLTIEAANEVGAQHLDLNLASTDYVNAIGKQSWNYDWGPNDRTHLNPTGTVVFGRMVADLLITERPDLEQYVAPNKALSDKIWAGEYATGSE